jgi:ketosteroid isomerase-like protein
MTRENVELVRGIWPRRVDMVEFLDTGLPLRPEVLEHFEPEAEIRFVAGATGVPPLSFRGFEGFLEGWRDWLAAFDRYELEIRELVDASDADVIALTHVRARTRRDGVLVEHDPAAVFTVRDGRVARVRFFLERDEAFAAVGRPQA